MTSKKILIAAILLLVICLSISGCVIQNDIGQTQTVDNISCTLQSVNTTFIGWNIGAVTFVLQNNGASAVQLGPNNFGDLMYSDSSPFMTTGDAITINSGATKIYTIDFSKSVLRVWGDQYIVFIGPNGDKASFRLHPF